MPGDVRSQGISSHDIDLVKPRWLGPRTSRANCITVWWFKETNGCWIPSVSSVSMLLLGYICQNLQSVLISSGGNDWNLSGIPYLIATNLNKKWGCIMQHIPETVWAAVGKHIMKIKHLIETEILFRVVDHSQISAANTRCFNMHWQVSE